MRILANRGRSVKGKNGIDFSLWVLAEKLVGKRHRLKSMPPEFALLQNAGEFFKIVDKAPVFQAAGFIIWRAQN